VLPHWFFIIISTLLLEFLIEFIIETVKKLYCFGFYQFISGVMFFFVIYFLHAYISRLSWKPAIFDKVETCIFRGKSNVALFLLSHPYTSSIPKCRFDFFHQLRLLVLFKIKFVIIIYFNYNMNYCIIHFKYIFNFFIILFFNKTNDQS
jgi:hypothetical protein